jgi:hypothetical protein
LLLGFERQFESPVGQLKRSLIRFFLGFFFLVELPRQAHILVGTGKFVDFAESLTLGKLGVVGIEILAVTAHLLALGWAVLGF